MKRTYIVLRSYPTATSEFWGGLFSTAWGLYVLTHIKALVNVTYLDFVRFLPREVWGGTLVIFGLLQIYAMNRLRPGWRMTAAICLMFIWTFITIFAWMTGETIVCLPFYTCMAIKEFWITLRASPPPHLDLPFAPKREEDLGGPDD